MGTGACQDNREYDRGDGHPGDEHKTICSLDGGGISTTTTSNRKRECAKTSQRESWTKTALGHEQVLREGRVPRASRLRTWSECDGGSNSDCWRCFKRAQSQRSESRRPTDGCLQSRGDDPEGDELDHQHQRKTDVEGGERT